MEEIEVGEYVRTKDGFIRKVDKIDKCPLCKEKEYINKEIISGLHFENTYHKKDILKHSPNIIDLIEEGDYVNGNIVYEVLDDEIELLSGKIRKKRIHFITGHLIDEEEIKSIVTHEQFAQIEYKVEE